MNPGNKPKRLSRITTLAAAVVLAAGIAAAVATSPVQAAASSAINANKATNVDNKNAGQLGNGVKHVVQLTFDNVHFFRDNPNVPSDLQLMPNLLNFFEDNGTFLSNNHTPLIAHTADDILPPNTGLYGDRQGMPISNSYQAYNGTPGSFTTTDPASSFAYWTDPVDDTSKTPRPADD